MIYLFTSKNKVSFYNFVRLLYFKKKSYNDNFLNIQINVLYNKKYDNIFDK